MITLVLYIGSLRILTTWFLCGRAELKLSCGNDPFVRNYIYSNGDLDLWPNNPKINRVLPHYKYNFWQQGCFHMITLVLYIGSLPNLGTRFPCGRGRKTILLSETLFIVSDLDLWPNNPKIKRVLPHPQGNHVAKLGKDPIWRTYLFLSHY
jgi:hypothetical protein